MEMQKRRELVQERVEMQKRRKVVQAETEIQWSGR